MSYTCALVGEGAIALRCAQMLRDRGVGLLLLGSADGSLAQAAEDWGVPHEQARQAWRSRLAEARPDVLLSVSNPWILQAQELSLVKRWSFNYHDSLLPRHAGMHATTWALMAGDVQHGITWHEVTADIDAGRVAVQLPVEVHPDDTAFNLNLRCYEAGIQGLSILLTQLDAGGPQWRDQAGEGEMHPARQRSAGQCAIRPAMSVKVIERFVRAHDFGRAHNPLGTPKLWLGGPCWLMIRGARSNDSQSLGLGLLQPHGANQWLLGSQDGDVVLTGHLHGRDVDASCWTSPVCVPDLAEPVITELSELHAATCLNERHWCAELLVQRQPAMAPGMPAAGLPAEGAAAQSHGLPLLADALSQLPAQARPSWALAAWTWLLQGLSAEPIVDMAVWHPKAVRMGLGLFSTVRPWRLRARPEAGFAALVAQVQSDLRSIEHHGTWAWDLLQRAPALHPAPAWPQAWPAGVWIDEAPPGQLDDGWRAVLAIDPRDGASTGWSPMRDARTWRALDRTMAHVVRAGWGDPLRPLQTLGWLDEAHAAMLQAWGTGDEPAWPPGALFAQIAQRADEDPEAPALRWGSKTVSRGALQRQVEAVAAQLHRQGCGRGERVALLLSHSIDAVVTMLAAWRLGAAYVPMDPAHPVARLKAMCDTAGIGLVVSHAATAEVAEALLRAGADLRSVPLWEEPLCAEAGVEPQPMPRFDIGDDDLAYCIFTSGSTGTPKGVAIAHGGLVNHAWSMARAYQLGPGQRCLLSASLAFDVAAEQIFPALVSGAEVVIKPRDLLSSLSVLHSFVEEQGLTVLTLPATLWHEWVAYLVDRQRPVPTSLRTIGVGTEKVSAQTLAQWQKLGGKQVRFIQGYGPTEATITCAVHVIDPATQVASDAPLPVGRPLAHTTLRVLDRHGQPTPAGMEGEVCVGGVGLAKGYLGQPELTLQRFVMHHEGADWPQRLYHTGDRGWWDDEGRLVIAGRTDFQVKILGYRVELGDIETVLMALPGVHACVVTLMASPGRPSTLVAHVATEGGVSGTDATLAPADILRHAQQHLPAHMVPQEVVLMGRLPVGLNGKVDRKALPMPDRTLQATVLAMPGTDVAADAQQVKVAAAFADVLGLPNVPLQQGFFDLGGSSLLALRLLARIERDCGQALSLSTLFAHPSVEGLSACLRGALTGAPPATPQPSVIQLSEGLGQPIWLLGGAHQYQALGRALAGRHPVFAVVLPEEEALARDGSALPALQDMAKAYATVMRQRNPRWPCAVGGFSFAGVLAHEVARMLLADQGLPSTLFLIDTALPSVYGPGAYRSGWWAWTLRQWHVLRRGGWAVVAGRARGLSERLRDRLRAPSQRPRADAARDQIEAHRVIAFARLLSQFEAVAKPHAGPTVIYRAIGEDHIRLPVPGLGFAPWLTGEVQEVGLPGRHHDLLAMPGVSALAHDLIQRLPQVTQAVAGASIPHRQAA